jgi:hypothetical protein
MVEYGPRRWSGFLGDEEYVYGPPPQLRRAPSDMNLEDAAPPEAEEQLVSGDDIPGKEKQTTPMTSSTSFRTRCRGQ